MKKKFAVLFTSVLIFSSANVFADESGYITKEQIEASGKSPYSVNYKYQQDYLTGKPVPESAVYYEKMVNKSALEAEGKGPDSVDEKYREDYFADKLIPVSAIHYKQKVSQNQSSKTTILNWNGEYTGYNRIVKIVQDGTKFSVTVTNNEKTTTSYNAVNALRNQFKIGNSYDRNSAEYERATRDNIVNNLYGNIKTTTIPAKTLFTTSGTLNNNIVWLYPGSNYQAKLAFEVVSQRNYDSYIEVTKQVTITDNTNKLGKNPFEPSGKSLEGTYMVTTIKYK